MKKEKNPEKQLSDMKIISFQEKDFRLMMMKMMQDNGNKLEAKTDNLQEILSNEIQDLKFMLKIKHISTFAIYFLVCFLCTK